MNDDGDNNYKRTQKDFLGKKRDYTSANNIKNPRQQEYRRNNQPGNPNDYYDSNPGRNFDSNFTENPKLKSESPPMKRMKGNECDFRNNNYDADRIIDNAGNNNNLNALNANESNYSDRNKNNNTNFSRNSSANNFNNNYDNYKSNSRGNYNSNNNERNNNNNNARNQNNFNQNNNNSRNFQNNNYSNNNNLINRPRNQNFSGQSKKPHNDQIRISYYGLENLPIMNHKEEIISLLASEQVIIISGTTGCGKTTQVPKFLYEKLQQDFPDIFELDNQGEKKNYRKILITQPRRIAAVSIAKRLCQELKCELGKEVGFHVGLNPNYNSNTRIVICTTGIFLQKIINDDSIKDYAYIVIDEVHERDADIDLLLAMLKHLICRNRQVKLILMSATISIKLFSGYFGKESIKTVKKTDVYEKFGIGKLFLKFIEKFLQKNSK